MHLGKILENVSQNDNSYRAPTWGFLPALFLLFISLVWSHTFWAMLDGEEFMEISDLRKK